ncbi:MAG: HEAT repeat domain-containing protein [Planctomycetes bacterium]|nr:HEAT repeat domain-containing protein [Planctomycetota bacterium]
MTHPAWPRGGWAVATAALLLMLTLPGPARTQEVEPPSDTRLDELYRTASLWQVGSNVEKVETARKALIAYGTPAVRYVLGKLDTDRTLELRAIQAVIDGVGATTAVPLLLPLLESSKPNVRRNAIDLCAQLKAGEAVEPIAKSLDDPAFILPAIRALGELGVAEAVPRILPALKNERETVRIAACTSLGKLKDPRAVPDLIAALEDPLATVRYPAQWALGALGTAATESCAQALSGARPRSRLHLVQVLASCGDGPAMAALQKLLKDEDWAVRGFAVAGLARFSEPAAMQTTLKGMLQTEEHPFVRGKLEEALKADR